ncbi:hypothetical protein [Slackia heliotrinireducens]|uniref:hypothetical protein n=1 Tax=Slackia heliotrinireducens TaxID=84110 RepID=UPI003315D479
MDDFATSSRVFEDDNDAFDFNPLEDFAFDDIDDDDDIVSGILDDGPYSIPNADNKPKFKSVSFDNAETPEERIETLFNQMPTQDDLLLGILDASQTPIFTDDLEQKVEELKQHHHSVYSPMSYCRLLERAGAIEQTNNEGLPLKEVEVEPDKVVVEGVEYWKVAAAPDVYWTATPAGLAHFQAYQPMELLRQMVQDEPQYEEIFRMVLSATAADGGESVKNIDDLVSDDPILQSPRRYAMYFIDKLERAGGIQWRGSWVATQAGKDFLAELNA